MQVLEHPFFSTLYIDPDEGLYWQSKLPLWGAEVAVGMYIDDANQVTPANLAKAQQFFEHKEQLAAAARNALEENYINRTNGPCSRYVTDHLSSINLEVAAAILPTLQGEPLCRYNFIQSMTISLIGVYPSDSLLPVIVEFTIGEELTSAVLSVAFAEDETVAAIEYLE